MRNHYQIWVEVVTNVIPRYNDDENELSELARWISEELGPDTPWHITRLFPHHRLSRLEPTPYETLTRARELGQAAGLKFVYLGNLPGDPAENTYCPGCGQVVIERRGYRVLSIKVHDSRCDHSRTPIPIRDRLP